MTKQNLSAAIRKVVLGCGIWVVLMLVARLAPCPPWMKQYLPFSRDALYTVLKDVIPLVLAWPVAFLSHAFQRRVSYLQALRTLYGDIILAIAQARQYTYAEDREESEWEDSLVALSKAIDGVRSVYYNLEESEQNTGLYPFEPLKEIYQAILQCPPNCDEAHRTSIRRLIDSKWKDVRHRFLDEFDRSMPTKPVTPYHKDGRTTK